MLSQLELTRDPVIVDEDSVIHPEALLNNTQGVSEGHFDGLVSMSSFQKPHEVVYDYNSATTRPDQASHYAAFTQPHYETQYLTTHAQMPSGLQNPAELPLLSAEQYGSHDGSYPPQTSPFHNFRQNPAVTSFSPSQGPAGRKLKIYVNSPEELDSAPQLLPTVVFGSRRCSGTIQRLMDPSQPSNYAITVDVPAFDSTGASNTNVSLYLDSNDGTQQEMTSPFGQYTYTDATAYSNMTSPSPSMSRKRKLSPSQTGDSPGKRMATQSLRASDQYDAITSSPLSSNELSPYSVNNQPVYGYAPTSSRPQSYTSQVPGATPRYGVSPQSTAAQLQMQPPSTDYSGYVQERPGVSTSMASYGGAALTSSAPALVRTSTLHPDASGSPHSMATTFNPYSMYPSNAKALLKLEGDLNTMAENWSADEIQSQRRLVRFRRDQTGCTINAAFEPVTPEDHARAPGNIYVNCIYWREKGACYITSVDTIQLLESLVAVRFTVEEKNRIRRNLEGFRPATVSKTRPECEEFFKTIMGFPSPKPRNIEKDVKVFPWRVLNVALKKIIGKYSASYASTAAALPSSMAGAASASQELLHRHTASPQPITTSAPGALHYPAPSMGPISMPPHVMMAGPAVMPASMAQSVSWHQSAPSYATDLSGARPSWDFSSFDVGAAPYGRGERIPSITQSLQNLGALNYGGFQYQEYATQRSTQA